MWSCLEAPPGGLSTALQVSSCLQFFLPLSSVSFPFHRALWLSLSICACLRWSSMWIKSEMTELGHLAVDMLMPWLLGSGHVHCFPVHHVNLIWPKSPVHENSQGESFNLFLLLIIYSLSMTHQTSDLQRCGCVVCAWLGTAAWGIKSEQQMWKMCLSRLSALPELTSESWKSSNLNLFRC